MSILDDMAIIKLVKGDITLSRADAIVNAANSGLMGGGGVDGAIHRAGGPAILEECKRIVASRGRLPAGQAVVTGGGRLKARFVVHTVGPIWRGGENGEAETLASSYRNSLSAARDAGADSVAFPSISTGAYGYPLDSAAAVAVKSVAAFLKDNPGAFREVLFFLFDDAAFSVYARALEAAGMKNADK